MTLEIGQNNRLLFETENMRKIPTVSGSGGSDWGNYQTSGHYDMTSGNGEYTLDFNWGQCQMSTRPSSGPGDDMMGTADMSCSGGGQPLNNVAYTESTGLQASGDKFVTDEKQVAMTCHLNNKSPTHATGVIAYFPKLTGHASDNKNGKYRIQSSKNTKLNGQNRASFIYNNGVVVHFVYTIRIGANGEFEMVGDYSETPQHMSGQMTCSAKINVAPVKGYCPNRGQTAPESWLWSWPEKEGCPYPDECPVTADVCDAWQKNRKVSIANGVQKSQKSYGFAMKVDVPEQYWTQKGWTVALRFPAGQKRVEVNVWNAIFLDVYESAQETVVVVTSRYYLNVDKQDVHSFVLTIDYLKSEDRPSILFWPERNRQGFCYNREVGAMNMMARTSSIGAPTPVNECSKITLGRSKKTKKIQVTDVTC